jgi:hypothetical protein
VAVDLVARRLEQRIGVGRIGGDDVGGTHDPDADALLPSRVDVAGVLERHGRVGGVHAADVLVIEAAVRADEDLVQRPVGGVGHAGTPGHAAAAAAAAACLAA